MNLNRYSAIDGGGTANGSMTLSGFEVFARTTTIGVYGRTISGTSSVNSQGLHGHFQMQEARIFLGDPQFSPEFGIIRRTTSAADPDSIRTFYRAGLRVQWEIGNSGIQVTLNGGAYFGKAQVADSGDVKILGASAEGTVLYQAPRKLPFYVLAGWRYERFDDYALVPQRSEENSGPFFGIGLRLGGRPGLR